MREREREAFFPDARNRPGPWRRRRATALRLRGTARPGRPGSAPVSGPVRLGFFWSDADTVPSQCLATVGPPFAEVKQTGEIQKAKGLDRHAVWIRGYLYVE